MRVATVTPYYREDAAILKQCHDSVRAQTHPCTHFMVADGFGQEDVDDWSITHVRLPRAHGDNGNAARCIGSFAAIAEGFDAIVYLDADNWFAPEHVESLVRLHERTGAAVCTSLRSLMRLNGTPLPPIEDMHDGVDFCDTSAMLLTREAFDLIPLWARMPKQLGPVCDRVFWASVVAKNVSRATTGQRTLLFRTQYAGHYLKAGEPPPPSAKGLTVETSEAIIAMKYWAQLTASGENVRYGIEGLLVVPGLQ